MAALGRSAVAALRVGVVVLNQDDQPVMVNPSARKLGLVGAGDQLDAAVCPLTARVRRTGRARRVEVDLPRPVRARGERRESCGVDLRIIPLEGGHVAIEAVDVTEAHRLAQARRDLVANVSHELKTPVGALRLLAEALVEATGGDDGGAVSPSRMPDVEAVRRFAERIRHESTRLGQLIGDLIELTRLQGAEPLFEPKPVVVDDVITEIADRISTPAAARGIEVLIGGAKGLVAQGNDGQLRTALANLAENAIAYSSEGTQVTISGCRGDGMVGIVVADQGIGIESKDLDRIFERFYRTDKARSRVTGGTGLGLAIVKHIVTNHGGRVDVTSEVGKGSTFTVWVPVCPETDVSESEG